MPDKNADFLAASIKTMQAKKWDISAAQINDKITVMVRVPPALLSARQTPAEQAIEVSTQVDHQGWRLVGFNYDGQSLFVDLVHDLMR
jgi:hypothetical protein